MVLEEDVTGVNPFIVIARVEHDDTYQVFQILSHCGRCLAYNGTVILSQWKRKYLWS